MCSRPNGRRPQARWHSKCRRHHHQKTHTPLHRRQTRCYQAKDHLTPPKRWIESSISNIDFHGVRPKISSFSATSTPILENEDSFFGSFHARHDYPHTSRLLHFQIHCYFLRNSIVHFCIIALCIFCQMLMKFHQKFTKIHRDFHKSEAEKTNFFWNKGEICDLLKSCEFFAENWKKFKIQFNSIRYWRFNALRSHPPGCFRCSRGRSHHMLGDKSRRCCRCSHRNRNGSPCSLSQVAKSLHHRHTIGLRVGDIGRKRLSGVRPRHWRTCSCLSCWGAEARWHSKCHRHHHQTTHAFLQSSWRSRSNQFQLHTHRYSPDIHRYCNTGGDRMIFAWPESNCRCEWLS